MTRRAWLIAVVLACATTACKKPRAKPAPGPGSGSAVVADDDGSAAPTAPAADQIKPMVWTIEASGKRSTLLATIDAGVDAEAQLPAAIWDQVKTSATVVTQWNLAEVTMAMLKRQSGSLAAELTPEQQTRLASVVGADQIAELDEVKTSFTVTVVSAHGLSTANPMQALINLTAQDAGVPTVYLETGVAQQAMLDRWLDGKALAALLADLDGVKAGNAALVAAYVRGDADAIAGMLDQRMPWKTAGRTGAELVAMKKATLDDRHLAWITFLTPLLAAGNAFIAVDATDAVGPAGLVELLRAAGYQVTRR